MRQGGGKLHRLRLHERGRRQTQQGAKLLEGRLQRRLGRNGGRLGLGGLKLGPKHVELAGQADLQPGLRGHLEAQAPFPALAGHSQELALLDHLVEGRGDIDGQTLARQPLMRNVLADLAVESEAALALALRIARAIDEAEHTGNENAAALARIGTAVAKYWNCKRAPGHVLEALECHGGSGYIEESILPRLYREAPVNAIWEGSGNVMCLDVLRAMAREPESVESFLAEVRLARGGSRALDAWIGRLEAELREPADVESRARSLAERMALALQASVLVRSAPAPVADAFCAGRLGEGGLVFGTLPSGVDLDPILERARPAL